MTYSLHITPYQAALLDGACRSAGLSLAGLLTLRAHRITAARNAPPVAEPAPSAPPAPAPTPAAEQPQELNLTC